MHPGTMMNSSGQSRTSTTDMRVALSPIEAGPGRCHRSRLQLARTARIDQVLPRSSVTVVTYPYYSKAVISLRRSWVEKVDLDRAGLSPQLSDYGRRPVGTRETRRPSRRTLEPNVGT